MTASGILRTSACCWAVALLAALFAFLYAVWRRLCDAVNNFPERARQSVGLRHHSYPRPDFMR
jgi:hypothetical protein